MIKLVAAALAIAVAVVLAASLHPAHDECDGTYQVDYGRC